MRERNQSRPDAEQLEENHDGRTMILLAASAALACGLLVAAGFFVVGLIFDEPMSEVVALNESESEVAQEDQSVVEPTAAVAAPTMPDPVSSALEPASSNRLAENSASAVSDSEPVVTEVAAVAPEPSAATSPEENSRAIAAAPVSENSPAPANPAVSAKPDPQPQPQTIPAELSPRTKPAVPSQVAAVTPVSAPEERPVSEQTVPPAKGTAKGTPLSYQWSPGQIQGYSVNMATTINGQKQSVSGTVELTCDEQPPKVDAKAAQEKSKPETGTGTGFGGSTTAAGRPLSIAIRVRSTSKAPCAGSDRFAVMIRFSSRRDPSSGNCRRRDQLACIVGAERSGLGILSAPAA